MEPDSKEHFKDIFNELTHQPKPKVLVDCSHLSYINSSCMGMLATFGIACKSRDGLMVMLHVESKVHEIFKRLQLDEIVAIADSEEDALGLLA